ncbi:MAG TPA: DUF4833 domain-containing protein [Sediminibacterium sp.]|nr:DUF4833 domain-containing protein [Sediminibacterium sp.]
MSQLCVRKAGSIRLVMITITIAVGMLPLKITRAGKVSGFSTEKEVLEPQDTFPVPANIKNQLFYLQRTTNTNTVIYALNVNAAGKLDESTPVKVFWIRYPEGGMRKELNFIQKAFAYGTMSEKNKDDSYTIQLVAYRKKELYLRRSPMGSSYRMYTLINRRNAELNRVFIRIDPGGTLFKPNVVYIELRGTDIATGKTIIERFKP